MRFNIKKIIAEKSVSNGLWLYALQFVNLVIPLLTLPYITRVLGADSYGVFSIALNIITYLQVVVEYGFGMSATRKVVTCSDSMKLNRIYTAVLLSRGCLLLVSIITGFGYVLINGLNSQLCCSFPILLICLLGYTVQMNWVFQGKEDMKYITIVTVISRVVSTILIFVLVKSTADLLLYCFLYAVSPFLSGFIGLAIARKRYKLHLVKIKWQDVWCELKDGFYVFTTQLNSRVFGSIGITFLGIYASSHAVGVYSAIQKIPNILALLWAPISQILYPIVSKKFTIGFEHGCNYVFHIRKKIIGGFFGIAGIVCLLAKPIISLYLGSEYVPYYTWLYPLISWLVISIDNNFWGIQILLGSHHDKEYGKAFTIGVIATVALNWILIIVFSADGAAVAPLISDTNLKLI